MTTDHNPMDAINTTDGNAERLATLKNLYPDLFTNEGKLNITELQKLADPNSVNETERFEFKWFGKSQAKRNAFAPTNATLVFDAARSVNPQSSQHMIIEGENLEVLKLLKEGYREKIKCIYIDPPYNTGKDFVYSDNFTQDKRAYWQDNGTVDAGLKVDSNSESDGRYHSHWLNMMFSRLLLARELLRDDGVIFISIDDNEVHHLRKLCDEVFGESNFVDSIVWKKRYGGGAKEKHLVTLHEYILVYAKNIDFIGEIFIPLTEESIARYYKLRDSNFDIRGPYRTHPIEAGKAVDARPNLVFSVVAPDGTKILPKRQWYWSSERVSGAILKNEIEFLKDSNGEWTIHSKQYLNDEDGNIRQAKAFSVIDNVYSQHGTNEILNHFGNAKMFSYPKPTQLLKQLYEIAGLENEIILDFFGGSGTTGEVVMELNKADGGNRQFILVQIPEQTDEASEAYKAGYKKISDITIARNQKVVAKLALEGVVTGFKVFKLAMSNFPRVLFELDPKLDEAGNLARLQQYINEKERQLFNTFDEAHLLTEIIIKRGFNLNYVATKAEQFTKNNVLWVTDGNKKAFVCLDDKLADESVAYFSKNTSEHFICLERALDTTKKWNLKHAMGQLFFAF